MHSWESTKYRRTPCCLAVYRRRTRLCSWIGAGDRREKWKIQYLVSRDRRGGMWTLHGRFAREYLKFSLVRFRWLHNRPRAGPHRLQIAAIASEHGSGEAFWKPESRMQVRPRNTYLTLVYHNPEHAPSLVDLNVLNMHLPSTPSMDSLI